MRSYSLVGSDGDEDNATAATRREGPATERAAHEPPSNEKLARGTLVGRYVVLDVLGEGGMGVVYGAYDPELDRKVAIKLLQTQAGGSSGGDKAWLVREAQALAKLSHPNVVAVHDVGTLPGDRVFIAMEFVDGMTLRAYLRDKPTWRDALAVMRAAGAGLAAAHAAGLVHRDFKPENVIVGKDGRVRVMDFGLARLQLDDTGEVHRPLRDSDLDIGSKSPLSERLTVAGTVVGTPAYMAPEIYNGYPADPGTDQFAFGVALYEALFRARPYDRKQLMDLMPAGEADRPKTPPDTGVPAAITRVVMRAISIRHQDRYPTIEALLAELAVDPIARKKQLALGAAAAVALAGIGAGAYVLHHGKGAQCTGIDQRLTGAWDAPTKLSIKKAFDATNSPYLEKSFAGLVKAMDGYTAQWTAAVTESCKATRVRGEQTEEVMSLRADCFDQRLAEVRALAHLLTDADKNLVEKGDKIVFDLDPLDACNNVAMLKAPGQPPPALRPKVHEIDASLADSKANLIAGKYLPSLVESQKQLDAAKALGWDPLIAEALMIRAGALIATLSYDEALLALQDATWAGMRGKRDDVVAQAAFSVAMVNATALGKPKDATFWIQLARAAMTRAGVSQDLQVRAATIAGLVAAETGDLNEAVAEHEKALSLGKAAYGSDNAQMTSLEMDLGTTLMRAGAQAKAVEHLEHALALRESSVGPDHPDVAIITSNLAMAYAHVSPDKARAMFDRAMKLREKLYGAKSPMMMAPLDNYAEFLGHQGDFDKAIPMVERAQQLARIVGTAHPMFHQVMSDHGEILIEAGRLDDAHKLYDELLPYEQDSKSSILAESENGRAKLALAEKSFADAETWAQRSLDDYVAAGGEANPALWKPLTTLAKAKLALGKRAEAKPLIERAIAIGEKASVPADELAPTRKLVNE